MSSEEEINQQKQARIERMSIEAKESIKRTIAQIEEYMAKQSPEKRSNELVNIVNNNPEKYSQSIKRIVEDLSTKPATDKRNQLMRKAMLGNYGDFTSSVACPKLLLIEHFNECGCQDLADKVERGYYDD